MKENVERKKQISEVGLNFGYYLGRDEKNVTIKPLTGGLTNVLYTCYNQKTNETVVYRLYGKVDGKVDGKIKACVFFQTGSIP